MYLAVCVRRKKNKWNPKNKTFSFYSFFFCSVRDRTYNNWRCLALNLSGNLHRYYSSLFLASMHRMELRNSDKYLHIRRHKIENTGESEWRMGKCKYECIWRTVFASPTLSPFWSTIKVMLEWFIDDLLHENKNNNDVRKLARARSNEKYLLNGFPAGWTEIRMQGQQMHFQFEMGRKTVAFNCVWIHCWHIQAIVVWTQTNRSRLEAQHKIDLAESRQNFWRRKL